ncbi:MAG TPA: transcriptional repressor LexA [Candidatus Saccharimonadales bacterium]|jgi:SOS regulatory protein LexA|nr:transcriptional repressor LexA [Candidatus Saccharimonadales bacterium]
MVNTLTDKQRKLLDFIKSYSTQHTYPPSLKEMGMYMGIRTLSTVHQHLAVLQAKGLIEKRDTRSRNIKVEDVPKLVKIPILGEIAAGLPIEPIEEPEPVYVSTQLVKNPSNHYALKVKGDSMIDDGIQDGDTVIIRAQNYVDYQGQTIVAIINGCATLKRFGGVDEDGMVRLIPRNPKMQVMLADLANFEIRGRLVGLVRSIT